MASAEALLKMSETSAVKSEAFFRFVKELRSGSRAIDPDLRRIVTVLWIRFQDLGPF